MPLLSHASDPAGPVILGICAGYQMLGQEIVDRFESRRGRVDGLGILAVRTEFEAEKLSRPRTGHSVGEPVTGYEIRQGRPIATAGAEPFTLLDDAFGAEPEGILAEAGRLAGTNLHGLFESDSFRHAFLAGVARRRGRAWAPGTVRFEAARQGQIDRLADLIEAHLASTPFANSSRTAGVRTA